MKGDADSAAVIHWTGVFVCSAFEELPCSLEVAISDPACHPALFDNVWTVTTIPLKVLEKKGLVDTSTDPGDQRKRLVSLSPNGMETAKKLQDTWADVLRATEELLQESDPDFLEHLSLLENALSCKSIFYRINSFYIRCLFELFFCLIFLNDINNTIWIYTSYNK